MIDRKKKQSRQSMPRTRPTKLRVLGFDAQEQKAYEESKKKIVSREARKEGRRRAEEELFKEEREIKEKKRKKELRKQMAIGTFKSVRGYAASIQAPKVSKSAKRGLFKRSTFGR